MYNVFEVLNMYQVIIVDDDRWAREDIKKSFCFSTYEFAVQAEYNSAETAFEGIKKSPPELVISDIRMGRWSGIDLIRKCRENEINSLFVIVSGYDDMEYIQEAFTYNAFYYILKPIEDDKVQKLMQRITDQLDTKNEAQRTERPLDTLGKAMQYIDEHFTEYVSLSVVADALFVNKNYLSDLFGKRLNMSFTQYRNFKRISHAEHLMKDKLLNMTDIAFACGFESLSRFSKVFKQFKGLSPLQYKEQNDEREIK